MTSKRNLSPSEVSERERVIKGLLKNKSNLVKKYGKDAEKVMYGVATKQARKKVEDNNKENLKELIKNSLKGYKLNS